MNVSQFTSGDAIPNEGCSSFAMDKEKADSSRNERPLRDGIRQVQFAQAWDGPIPSRVVTSPIERCVQTHRSLPKPITGSKPCMNHDCLETQALLSLIQRR